MQLLFWNRWNQESAGRVYFNISREKPTHTPDTPHVQLLSRANLNGPIRETFIVFLLKSIRDNLAPGFPRALDLYPRHAQKSSGSRLFEKAFFIILNRDDWYIFPTILVSLCFFYPFIIPWFWWCHWPLFPVTLYFTDNTRNGWNKPLTTAFPCVLILLKMSCGKRWKWHFQDPIN